MADVSLDDLIARARLESGLRNNAYYDSDQIIRYLDAGGSELADIFTQANQHYVIKEFDFTTAGEADAIVPLPDAFQQGHSLEAYPDAPGQTRTIKFLPNWLNRNAFVGSVFPFSPGGYYPVYTFLGNQLRFYPPQATPAAPFRLYYTPKWTTLAAPTTPPSHSVSLSTGDVVAAIGRWTFPAAAFSDSDIGASFTVTGATAPTDNGTFVITSVGNSTTVYTATTGLVNETFGIGVSASIEPTSASARTFAVTPADAYNGGQRQWSISAAAFTASDVGGVMTVEMDSPNRSFSGQYLISTVLSATSVIVESVQTGSLSGAPSGIVVLDRRQFNTVPALPAIMSPWLEYPVVYAAIAINTDRQRGTSELERKLQALKVRIASTISQRQEEPLQPPLTRGTGDDGWGGGWQ